MLAPSLSLSKGRLLHFTVPDRHQWEAAGIYVSFYILIFPLYILYFNFSTVQCPKWSVTTLFQTRVTNLQSCSPPPASGDFNPPSLTLSLRNGQLVHPDSYCMSPRCSQVHPLIVLLSFLVTKTWQSYICTSLVLLWPCNTIYFNTHKRMSQLR